MDTQAGSTKRGPKQAESKSSLQVDLFWAEPFKSEFLFSNYAVLAMDTEKQCEPNGSDYMLARWRELTPKQVQIVYLCLPGVSMTL